MPFKGRRLSFEEPLSRPTYVNDNAGTITDDEVKLESEARPHAPHGGPYQYGLYADEFHKAPRYSKYGVGFSYQSQARSGFFASRERYRRLARTVRAALGHSLSRMRRIYLPAFSTSRPETFGPRLPVVPAEQAYTHSFFLWLLTNLFLLDMQRYNYDFGFYSGQRDPRYPSFYKQYEGRFPYLTAPAEKVGPPDSAGLAGSGPQ